MKWKCGHFSLLILLLKVAEEELLLDLQVRFCAPFNYCTFLYLDIIQYFHVYSCLADQTEIQITVVTTHSITLVPSPPSGTVYYKEVGSSAQPRHVPYSNTVTITQLQPNTEYNITYVTGNGLGVNRAEVRVFTLAAGRMTGSVFYLVANTVV